MSSGLLESQCVVETLIPHDRNVDGMFKGAWTIDIIEKACCMSEELSKYCVVLFSFPKLTPLIEPVTYMVWYYMLLTFHHDHFLAELYIY